MFSCVSNVEIHRRFSHATLKSLLPAVLLTAKQKRVMNRGVSCEISWTMADSCSLMNIIIILIRPAFDSTSKGIRFYWDILLSFYHACLSCVCQRGVGLLVYGEMDYYPDEKKRKEEGEKIRFMVDSLFTDQIPSPGTVLSLRPLPSLTLLPAKSSIKMHKSDWF